MLSAQFKVLCGVSCGYWPREVAQRDTVSSAIFNIVVDSVVRACIAEVYNPEVSNKGLGYTVE